MALFCSGWEKLRDESGKCNQTAAISDVLQAKRLQLAGMKTTERRLSSAKGRLLKEPSNTWQALGDEQVSGVMRRLQTQGREATVTGTKEWLQKQNWVIKRQTCQLSEWQWLQCISNIVLCLKLLNIVVHALWPLSCKK